MQKSNLFSNQLHQFVEQKEKEAAEKQKDTLTRLVDGEPVNRDPLTEIPEPQMRLYGFSGVFHSAFFDTEEELQLWISDHSIEFGSICVLDYLGDIAGREDVMRYTYMNGTERMIAPCDIDGYGIYNKKRSIYCGRFIWEYFYGDIQNEVQAFRDRGIEFQNDIYAEREKLLQWMREVREKKQKED